MHFRVELARAEDDADLRRLSREGAMRGRIHVALEREPSFSAARAIEGERHYTAVVRDSASGEIVGMGTRSVREVWVNGERRWLGCLGALRAAPGRRGLVRLAAGYRELEATRRAEELPFDLTSVISDNTPARRLLERGLPGLPRYEPLCEYLTLLVPIARRRRGVSPNIEEASDDDLPSIAEFLRDRFARYQLAPVYTAERLRSRLLHRDLSPCDFVIVRDGGRIVACAACWDQRRVKQVVVRGYAPWIARARPLLNTALRLAGQPRLPRIGAAYPLAYVSHLAIPEDRPELARDLIDALCERCVGRGLEALAVGFASENPLCRAVRRAYPVISYASRLYRVSWRGVHAIELDDRIPHVEVATL